MAHPHFPRNKIPLSVTIEAWALVASIIAAYFLFKSDVLTSFIAQQRDHHLLISFVSGVLFSSGIVTPLAIVAIMDSAKEIPLWELSLVGAVGSVCGDLLLFRFVRSRLVEYILKVSLHPRVLRMGRSIAAGPFWWIGPLLGAVVIASPLPDELGLVMMGLSTIRLSTFIPLALVANIVGIWLIAISGPLFG